LTETSKAGVALSRARRLNSEKETMKSFIRPTAVDADEIPVAGDVER
jgi:hypothetical protein